MDQRQQELRQSANQAFMESLSQLGQRLTPIGNEAASTENPLPAANSSSNQTKSSKIDLSELEEAAADIERFIESSQSEAG